MSDWGFSPRTCLTEGFELLARASRALFAAVAVVSLVWFAAVLAGFDGRSGNALADLVANVGLGAFEKAALIAVLVAAHPGAATAARRFGADGAFKVFCVHAAMLLAVLGGMVVVGPVLMVALALPLYALAHLAAVWAVQAQMWPAAAFVRAFKQLQHTGERAWVFLLTLIVGSEILQALLLAALKPAEAADRLHEWLALLPPTLVQIATLAVVVATWFRLPPGRST